MSTRDEVFAGLRVAEADTQEALHSVRAYKALLKLMDAHPTAGTVREALAMEGKDLSAYLLGAA